MKLWIKILITSILVLAAIFSSAFLFLVFDGKNIIIRKLQDMTHKKVTIEHLRVLPPLNLYIDNLEIEGMARIKRVSVSMNPSFLLAGTFALNRVTIENPEFTFEKKAPEKPAEPAAAQEKAPAEKPAAAEEKSRLISPPEQQESPFALKLQHLVIKDGTIHFIDHSAGPDGIKLTFKNLDFKLDNLYVFPSSIITKFDLRGQIPWQEGKEEGKIELNGWMDFTKRDMQASLKILDIDGIYLQPYYSTYVDLEKARIEKANLNFTSNIQGFENNITAECHLELTNIVRKPRPPEELPEKAEKVTDAVLDIFKNQEQGKIVFDFTYRTKMDRPHFGVDIIRIAFENRITEARSASGIKATGVLFLPAKILEGVVNSVSEVSKAVIQGTFAVGNEMKKSVEDAFKKEPKKEKK